MEKNNTLHVYYLGKQDFEKITVDMQEKLIRNLSLGIGKDVLLLFEPNGPTYTLGALARGRPKEEFFLRQNDAKVMVVSRGGSITYHGPGQIVGYPVIDLQNKPYGCGGFMEKFEKAMHKVVQDIGVFDAKVISEPMDDPRVGKDIKKRQFAVWHQNVNGKLSKIVAFGVRFQELRYTMHGFALNVSTDLQYFNDINPCGFKDKGAASIETLLKKAPRVTSIIPLIAKHISLELGYDAYNILTLNEKVLKAVI